MSMLYGICISILTWAWQTSALRYDPAEVEYNLNQNQQAVLPLDYRGQWQ